jgi:hypothetical protein
MAAAVVAPAWFPMGLAYRVAVQVEEEASAPPSPASPSAVDHPTGSSWRVAVVPWLVSRVLSVTVLLVAIHDPGRGSKLDQYVLRWDGGWYLGIARDGYGMLHLSQSRWAFLPGLPAVIKVAGWLGAQRLGPLIVSEVAFLVALAGVHRLGVRHASRRAAALAVWSIALFPASFVFSMMYPSALFLAATVWAFVLVEDSRFVAAGALVTAATLLRPNGIVVAVAVAVAFSRQTWRRAVVVCGPAVVALAAWSWYCWDRTGDAFAFVTAKGGWQEITLAGLVQGHSKLSVLPHLVLAAGALGVVMWQRRRLPISWVVLTGLALLPSLATGMVGLGRYANECFPPFVAAGQVLERWATRVVVGLLVAAGAGLVVFAYVVGHYDLVP